MEIIINNNLFKVKCIKSKQDVEEGMMFKKFDDDFDGLLFLMPDRQHSFWMKNCIIPLDIIFISNNKVTKIHHNCPPCDKDSCEHYPGSGNKVLEVLGGTCKNYDIVEGDRVYFN